MLLECVSGFMLVGEPSKPANLVFFWWVLRNDMT
jgi:hypothetical protein